MEINQTISAGHCDKIELAKMENDIIIRLISIKNYSTMIINQEQGKDLLNKLKEVYKC